MAYTVNPDFRNDLARFGAGTVTSCFNCGNCTAVCPLSEGDAVFPRKLIRYVQLGLEQRLVDSPEPWLCFYCGECSKTCPRGANPGETMMAARRYLTVQYDWTGISSLMYRSAFWEIGVLMLVAAAVVFLFTLPQSFGFGLLSHSTPLAMSSVMLDKFAPKMIVHRGDQILALILAFFLLTNAARMFFALTRGDNIPLRFYFQQLPSLVWQGLTQSRWKQCDDTEATRSWVRHLFLVTGYLTIFVLVALFLPWFQVENSSFQWTSILGYYSTVVLLGTTAWILLDRMWHRSEMHRFSHLSDWLFPILLFLTALTGILMHIFRLLNLAMPTYETYMVHMAIAVPMLVVEVPFGKWSHLLYRPLAIFIVAVRRKSVELGSLSPADAGIHPQTT